MSGSCQRNIVPCEKRQINRNLPEISDNSVDSPRRKIIDRSFNNVGYSANNFYNTRTNYNSTVSSAQSQKFQDLFYRDDWPSLSDTETDSPDGLELEGSDSSASSMFSWADMDGTRRVIEEWEKIQRTLYDEEGPKVTQKHLLDECHQWRTIFPHLRIVGRGFFLTDPNHDKSYDTEEEVLALNYESDVNSDMNISTLNDQENTLYKHFDEQNMIPPISNTKSFDQNLKNRYSSSKSGMKSNAISLFEDLDTILHISPISYSLCSSNTGLRNKTSSVVKSEMNSSRWRHRNANSPDFVSLPFQSTIETRDSSASSLDDVKYNKSRLLSENIWSGFITRANTNQIDDQHKYNGDKSQLLQPIELGARRSVMNSHQEPHTPKNRNISLPPIHSNDNKVKRKTFLDSCNALSGKAYRKNKKILSPLDITSTTVPKHNIKIDVDALSVFESRSAVPKNKKNKRK